VCLQSVGSKTAQQLVQTFGTVEQVFQQLAALSEEQQKQVGIGARAVGVVAAAHCSCVM
jgi:5'-3' exonuclease